jgi:hypothetical protein
VSAARAHLRVLPGGRCELDDDTVYRAPRLALLDALEPDAGPGRLPSLGEFLARAVALLDGDGRGRGRARASRPALALAAASGGAAVAQRLDGPARPVGPVLRLLVGGGAGGER